MNQYLFRSVLSNANNSGIRNYPTTTISVAGGAGNGLVYLLDGATHNDPSAMRKRGGLRRTILIPRTT